MTALKSLDNFIGKLLEVVITLCLGSVVIITFLQVIFRYVLDQPLTWSQEALMIAFVYSSLFGAALAIRNGDHLKVDLFEKVPKSINIVLKSIEFIIVGVLIVVLFLYGTELVQNNFKSGQTMSMLPLKMAYVYMALPISSVFMAYYHVRKVFT